MIYEAFAAKIPVIASDLGGMAEAVTHEVNGLLFERGNIDQLTVQLRRLIQEPDLVMQLGRRFLEPFEFFCLSLTVMRW